MTSIMDIPFDVVKLFISDIRSWYNLRFTCRTFYNSLHIIPFQLMLEYVKPKILRTVKLHRVGIMLRYKCIQYFNHNNLAVIKHNEKKYLRLQKTVNVPITEIKKLARILYADYTYLTEYHYMYTGIKKPSLCYDNYVYRIYQNQEGPIFSYYKYARIGKFRYYDIPVENYDKLVNSTYANVCKEVTEKPYYYLDIPCCEEDLSDSSSDE